jgi:hypothetical protein
MNGAAPVLASATRMAKTPIRIKIGNSYHFLFSVKKPKNSAARLGCFSFARRSRRSVQSGSLAMVCLIGSKIAVEPTFGPVGLPFALRGGIGLAPEGV